MQGSHGLTAVMQRFGNSEAAIRTPRCAVAPRPFSASKSSVRRHESAGGERGGGFAGEKAERGSFRAAVAFQVLAALAAISHARKN